MTFGVKSISINLDRLDHGMDFRGDYCGKNFLKDRKYVYWLDPIGLGINVKVCSKSCPTAANIKICLYNQENTNIVEGFCKLSYLTEADGYNCLPTDNKAYYKLIYNYITSYEEWWIGFAYDLKISFEAIVICVGLG